MTQTQSTHSFSSLSVMPVEVSKLLSQFSAEDLNWKPASWDGIPGEHFSALEQICHMRDIETYGYHKRISAILNENFPTLASVEGYQLVHDLDYAHTDLQQAILDFTIAREKTITLIDSIQPDQWLRTGYFDGYGNVRLRALVHFLCSHDLEHLASMRWLLGKIEGEKAKPRLI